MSLFFGYSILSVLNLSLFLTPIIYFFVSTYLMILLYSFYI
nr:MAG TPA: hypothetical protein [Caudoviricetes sp.]